MSPQPNHHRLVCNTLMMSHVCRFLSTARHHAWTCSAGPKGYCATKDMLQNGLCGHTLLIESRDLRSVEAGSSEGEECCIVFNFSNTPSSLQEYKNHIPSTAKHITAYSNDISPPLDFLKATAITSIDLSPLEHVTEVRLGFLGGCTLLTALNLSPLSRVTKIGEYFLRGCSGLTSLDLSPLSQVTEVSLYFLAGCTALTSLDLSPLSQLIEIKGGFLCNCTRLTVLDLSPFSKVEKVGSEFLLDCTGLTTLNLSPLSNITVVQTSFLARCTGLNSLDLSPLSQLRMVYDHFLAGCAGVTSVDNPPPTCYPPYGWSHKINTSTCTNQWVRQLLAGN